MLHPEHASAAAALSFDEDDLLNILGRYNLGRLVTGKGGHNDLHIARVPDRNDILLRWTRPTSDVFPRFADQSTLTAHVTTYEGRLARLAARGIVIPQHASFSLAPCPQQKVPTVYTVVEKVDTTPLAKSSNYRLIARTGHVLLDEALQPTPHIWDNTKMSQYGVIGDTAVGLDLDVFLTDDPRRAFPKLIEWGNSIAQHDGGALSGRAHEGYRAARAQYEMQRSGIVAQEI